MRLKVQLDTKSLLKQTKLACHYSRHLQRKLVRRLTDGRRFAVWELPFDHPEMTKEFVARLNEVFPIEVLQERLLFVNNGHGGAHQCFVAAGFAEPLYDYVQPTLSTFVGIIQNFQMTPETLISLAAHGLFEMEVQATPDSVDRAYGPNQAPPGP